MQKNGGQIYCALFRILLQWLEIHQKHSIITCPKPTVADRLAPFWDMFFSLHKCHLCLFQTKYSEVFKIVYRMGRHWFSLDIFSSHHRSRYRLRQLPLRTLRLNVPWSFRAVWCFCRQDPWGRWKIHGLWRIGILGVLAMLETLQPSRTGLEEHAIILVTHYAHVFSLNKRIGT